MAAASALAKPDILRIVLSFVHEGNSATIKSKQARLFPCLLVNTTWFVWSKELLWAQVLDTRLLDAIPPGRRQSYADVVRVLIIRASQDSNVPSSCGVIFKRLKTLIIALSRHTFATSITNPYFSALPPRVDVLSIRVDSRPPYCSKPSDAEILYGQTVPLRSFDLTGDTQNHTQYNTAGLKKVMRLVTGLKIKESVEMVGSFSRMHEQNLQFCKELMEEKSSLVTFKSDWVQKICTTDHISRLERINIQNLCGLQPDLPNTLLLKNYGLRYFHLEIKNSMLQMALDPRTGFMKQMFAGLAQNENLRVVEIQSLEPSKNPFMMINIAKEHFLEFTNSCRCLEELAIKTSGSSNIDDATIETFSRAHPSLRLSRVTVASFLDVCRYCPNLKSLGLNATVDFSVPTINDYHSHEGLRRLEVGPPEKCIESGSQFHRWDIYIKCAIGEHFPNLDKVNGIKFFPRLL